jgi:hypothetical protein
VSCKSRRGNPGGSFLDCFGMLTEASSVMALLLYTSCDIELTPATRGHLLYQPVYPAGMLFLR